MILPDLAIAGKVRQEIRRGSPHLVYQVTFGNRGCSAAHDVRVMVEFPPVLAGRARGANPQLSYGSLGWGQRVGFGGDVTFDVPGLDPATVRDALNEGITVQITLMDAGLRRERKFVVASK